MTIPPRHRPSRTMIVAPLVAAVAAALLFLIGPMTAGARAADAPPPPKGMALLVAGGEYRHARMNEPKLEFPEADAKAMAKLFTAAGYSVKTLLGKEATQGAIRRELEAIASGGDGKGVAVVGLFGHGVQVGADAHYCGYDAGVRNVTDSDGTVIREKDGKAMLEPDPATLVSMRDILDALARTGAGGKFLLADCCRKDPAGARGRAFGSAVAVADLPGNTVALFACEKDEQAFEHRDRGHGAFTKAFLDACEANPAMSAAEIYGQVRRSVRGLVAAKVPRASQTPHGLINGDIDLGLAAAFGNKPRPNPPPASEAGEPITNSLGMKLVRIPAGEFLMGGDETVEELKRAGFTIPEGLDVSDERPRHTVKLTKDFFLGQTEVTLGQFLEFYNDGFKGKLDCEKDGKGGWGWTGEKFSQESRFRPWSWGHPDMDLSTEAGKKRAFRHPVVNVSWNDCVAFCEWLSKKEGKTYRLPTEAEWEYACRAGTTTRFWHGDDREGLVGIGNISDGSAEERSPGRERTVRGRDGFAFTAPVGSFDSPNPFGLEDMHGNVAEWCLDWYGESYYATSPASDPKSPRAGSFRVIRGGGWDYYPVYCRSAYRVVVTSSYRSDSVGFRVVQE